MSVTLRQLLEESPKLELARADEPVDLAMARMLEHDYSQLPVIEGEPERPRAVGVISTTSIARASLHLNLAPSQLRVHHALDAHPIKKGLDDELWRTLDEAREGEVLLVEDREGVLHGILTSHDFTAYLRQQSEDRLTLRDIESTIKQLISSHYHEREDELRGVVQEVLGHQHRSLEKSVRGVVTRCIASTSASPRELSNETFTTAFVDKFPDKTPDDFDRLSFYQYQELLLGEPCWSAYKDAFDLPVGHLRGLLNDARELRNRVAHHRGLPSPAERAKLNFCRELLGRVADRHAAAEEPSPEPPPAPEPPAQGPGEPAPPSPDEDEDEDDESQAPRSALTAWLAGITGKDRISVAFDVIHTQLASGLPRTAHEHRSWWTNNEDAPQSSHWLNANWRVVSVNLTTKTVTFGRNSGREKQCLAAFGTLFSRLAELDSWTLEVPSPAGRTFQSLHHFSDGESRGALNFAFAKGDRFCISLYIDSGDRAANKASFDALQDQRDELERAVGAALQWERLPHRRASRVGLYYPRSISIRSAEEELDALADWVATYAPRFYEAMRSVYETRGAEAS